MVMDFSTLKSQNGEKYDDFVKKAKENKKFEFTLDGNTYRSDEYEMENAKFWRMFRNNENLIPLKIFISFEDHMEEKIFGEYSFPERFTDINITSYDFVVETPSTKNKEKNGEDENSGDKESTEEKGKDEKKNNKKK